jgi:hypothetical protein
MTQVLEHLLSKCEAMSSVPNNETKAMRTQHSLLRAIQDKKKRGIWEFLDSVLEKFDTDHSV